MKKSFLWIILIWLIGAILYLYYIPEFENSRDFINYIILMVSYIYVPAIYIFSLNKYKIDIFEPCNIFFVLWYLIYTITPLLLILQNNTLCQGIDVMDGCVKATLIYMICFTIFCITYFGNTKNTKINRKEKYEKQIYTFDIERYSLGQRRNIAIIALIAWLVCYLISLFYLIKTGRGLSYILTLGLAGQKVETAEFSIGFLENISYCMIGFWLYFCVVSKNKFLKIVLAFFTATAYLIRGFRFVVIIMFMAYAIVHYTRNNRRPKTRQIIVCVLCALVFIGVLGAVRGDLRTGTKIDFSSLGIDDITYALYTNFNIYQIYYGLVNALPFKHGFGGFQIAIENLSVFIPRILWPGKLPTKELLCYRLIGISVSDYAVYHAAMATPDLGAYYMQFGTIGCILYTFIWGKICKNMKYLFYRKTFNIHVFISYAIFVPSLLQAIIRGGDLFDIVRKIGFFFIPILVMKIFEKFGVISSNINRLNVMEEPV